MAENYMKDSNVRQYYNFWINGPTLFEHIRDRERFYKFVKAVVNWAGGRESQGSRELQKKIDTSFLALHIYDSFHDKYSEEYYDKLKHEILVEFEKLIEYEDTEY